MLANRGCGSGSGWHVERERAARRGAPGWLGITPRYDPQAVLAFGDGACVGEVQPRSPAWRAGVRMGDVIEPINVPGIGQVPLENFDTLRLAAVSGTSPASTLRFADGKGFLNRRQYGRIIPAGGTTSRHACHSAAPPRPAMTRAACTLLGCLRRPKPT